jgi:2-polyprenyl-6-methoxyphenol hydroxylase-like FAD-dependent oxidoreductase
MSDCEVLIVGAGPTGLTLALELQIRGVRYRLVDKFVERSDKSRALVVQSRTLELLDKHDLARPLIEKGRQTYDVTIYTNRRERVSLTLRDLGFEGTPFPFALFVSQAETERVLEEALLRAGGRVEHPVEVVALAQDDEGVRATLCHPDGRTEEVRAAYAVGCDGAHSLVRKAAGLRFEGAAYPQDFILADVEIDWQQEPRLRFFLARSGILAFIPLTGSTYRILSTMRGDPGATGEPTLDEFQRLVDRWSSLPMRLHDPRWLAKFHLHHRGVDRYRAGRLFVAGDAAHIHSPAGGQGMNTGIQDAYNLGWKLAMVLRGEGGDRLLDSYHAERYPVGQQLLKGTDRLFSFASSRNPLVTTVRDAMARWVVPRVLADRGRRAKAFGFVSELGIAYPDSPIVCDAVGDPGHGLRAGSRVPDLAIGSGTLFDLLRGPAHHLLVFPGVVGDGGVPAGWPAYVTLHVVGAEVDPHGDMRRTFGLESGGLALVRPDGYLAYRTLSREGADLLALLRTTYWEPAVRSSAS